MQTQTVLARDIIPGDRLMPERLTVRIIERCGTDVLHFDTGGTPVYVGKDSVQTIELRPTPADHQVSVRPGIKGQESNFVVECSCQERPISNIATLNPAVAVETASRHLLQQFVGTPEYAGR